MKVAVIGAGGMGGGIARLLTSSHDVLIGSRDAGRAAEKAKELGAAGGGAYRDVAADADVVFLTVPWVAVEETLPQLGDLTGKILVDVTNPYVNGGLQLHTNSSDAEEIQKRLPETHVVKGWNTVLAPVVQNGPDFAGQSASVFLAGDDDGAKSTVSSLARDMGFDPVDCGPLSGARDLERLLGVLGTIGKNLEWGSWTLRVFRRS
jgi:8-hydroxy-5-deazaflavin:NADPH oxidoreductase